MKIKALFAALSLSLPLSLHATELSTLADWMTGSFNSKAQAETNEAYFDINLEMAQIWADRTDATWLYVEQAVSKSLDKPYRQRIYKLEKVGDNQFISTVYSLPEPKAVVGAWKAPASLNSLTPDNLLLREGCHINIDAEQKDGKLIFTGSTEEKLCSSKLRGASYATSHVDIRDDVLTSWDQGFDGADKQVWGAEQGPYVFDKVKNYSIK